MHERLSPGPFNGRSHPTEFRPARTDELSAVRDHRELGIIIFCPFGFPDALARSFGDDVLPGQGFEYCKQLL
ncbi:MAG: hypothetical protein KatS3mg112_1364 [Thermogutta sp.]|nr:MAG: hypothetical protein KatS3mg112_1364 [Thermogutta sp.]